MWDSQTIWEKLGCILIITAWVWGFLITLAYGGFKKDDDDSTNNLE